MQVDTRYLKHYGVDDTSWYTHRFGKWQPQAKYANGKYEDGSSVGSNYGDVDSRAKEEKRIAKEQRKARRDAKNDYNIQMADRGNLASTIKLVSGKVAVASVVAGPLAATLYTSYATGKQIKDYNKRHGDNANYYTLGSYKRVTNNSHKPLKKRLSDSTVKDLKLSKEYVKEYSKAMDEMVKKCGDYKVSKGKKTYKNHEGVLGKVVDTAASLGNLPLTTAVSNMLMSEVVTGGTSLLGDVRGVVQPTLQKAFGKIDPKTGLNLKTVDLGKQADMKIVNPGYKGIITTLTRSGNRTNCMDCTVAYELRRRGYDVSARLNKSGHVSNDILSAFKDAKQTVLLNSSPIKTSLGRGATAEEATKAVSELARQGPGARGGLTVLWKNGWGGHSVAYEVNDAGKVIIRDSQVNKIYDDAVSYFTNRVTYVEAVRLDNLSLNPSNLKDFIK